MRKAAFVLVWTLALGGAPAHGDGTLLDFHPPFAPAGHAATSSVALPCRPSGATQPRSASDAAGGLFSIGSKAAAGGCRSHSFGRMEAWDLGEVPVALVGLPARVTVTFERPVFRASGSGSGRRTSAVLVRAGDSEPLRLYYASCRSRCAVSAPRLRDDGSLAVTLSVSALPHRLRLATTVSSAQIGGSGSQAARFTARVRGASISLLPAAGPPA